MRLLIVALLAGLALWQAWIDWQATIGEGYAYRLTPLGDALERRWPEAHAGLADGAWEPVGSALMAVPLALVPAALALVLWLTRRRGRRA